MFDLSVLCVTLTALPEEAGDDYQDRVLFIDSEQIYDRFLSHACFQLGV